MNLDNYKDILERLYNNKELPKAAKAAAMGILAEELFTLSQQKLPWEATRYIELSQQALHKCTELGGETDEGHAFLKEHKLLR